MRRFISQTNKGITSIIELEVEPVSVLEDQSILWRLNPDEYYYKVIKPQSLAGENYYSFFLFDKLDECLENAKSEIILEVERTAAKNHSQVDDIELKHRLSSIQIRQL